MAAITAAMVKELRERTGLGMMDCKKALAETDGDMEAAIDKLRRDSGLKAAKKAGRTAAEGVVAAKVGDDAARGVLVEVNIETDFAARNEKFVDFVDRVAGRAFDAKTEDVEAVVDAPLSEAREALVQEIGENIRVRRIALLDGGVVGGYVHGDHRKGALIQLQGGDAELCRDLAMHVVAMAPLVTHPEEIDSSLMDREREIYEAQANESGKPPEIVEKMVQGRLAKFAAESSLLKQPFVKDPDQTVEQLLEARGARCVAFARFEVGEGIARDESDFAGEVAAQVGGRG